MTSKVNCESFKLKGLIKANTFLNITKTIICRLILFGVSTYYIYIMSCLLDTTYALLFILNIIIVIDTLWICVRRKGVDFKW